MQAIVNFFQENFFVFELLICYLAYVPLLKPRKYFLLRLIGCIIVCVLYSQFVSHYLRSDNETLSTLLSMLNFLLLAVLTVVGLKISFEDNIWALILCGISAYATQHIFYRLRIFTVVLLDRLEVNYEWLNYIYYWTELIAVVVLCYFLFTRKLKKEAEFKINNKEVLLWTGIILITAIALNSISMFAMFAAEWSIVIALNAYGLLTCLFLLFCLFNNAYNRTLKEEVKTIKLLWQKDRQQYEISKQNVELMNMKFHDLKYLINGKIDFDDKTAKEEILRCLELYDSAYHTENEVLDVVLTEKKILCDKLGIRFSCMADGKILTMMSSGDIYSLFGNAIDNAIECLKKVEDEEQRNVKILVNRVNEMAKITIENYVPWLPQIIDGIPKTTKDDTDSHGYGIKSMQYIVRKYGGVMDIGVDENIFHVDILLPL